MKDLQTESKDGGVEGAIMEFSAPAGDAALAPGSRSPRVSLEAEVPEALFDGMREFIRNHPQWDQYSVITSALAGFLFQNGAQGICVKDHDLATSFSDR
ncbi:MAG: DUF2811 domain-containing protein [Cyanobacteriota bacterium]